MDNEPEPQVIRHQMEETREALTDKLEKLEEQVKETVQGATDAVHSVTEAVQTVKGTVEDTVESVKDSVHETVETVTGSVTGTVHAVMEQLDVPRQVERHPWMMMLGAVAVGYVGGRLLLRTIPEPASTMSMGAVPAFTPAPHGNGAGVAARNGEAGGKRGWLATLMDHYSEELGQLKSLALGAAGGVVREALVASAPPAVSEKISEVVDSVTTKLGGQPIKGPILESFAGQGPAKGEVGEPWERPTSAKPAGVTPGSRYESLA